MTTSDASQPTLLQVDFPFAGPWGDAMGAAMQDLAADIANEPGLIWKLWTENQEEGRAGGIYLFSDATTASAYLHKHTARLTNFGIEGIVARSFQLNAALGKITRSPVARQIGE